MLMSIASTAARARSGRMSLRIAECDEPLFAPAAASPWRSPRTPHRGDGADHGDDDDQGLTTQSSVGGLPWG